MGSSGEDPTDEPPKLILILEINVKLIFYGAKIENAYMSHCFLKRTHAAVLSAVQLTIRIGGWLYGHPHHNFFEGDASLHPSWLTPIAQRIV